MAIIDQWIRAAKRPDCLLAVFPYRGGVWLSPLKPGVAWPASTPRNFATEPACWDDFQRWIKENFSAADNFEFTQEIDIASAVSDAQFFGLNSTSTFLSLFYNFSQTNFQVITSLVGTTSHPAFSWFDMGDIGLGSHRIKVSVIGNIFAVNLDGTIKTQEVIRRTTFGNVRGNSTFDGTIPLLEFKNLTTGKSWSYPTWAEEKGLIKKTNVWTGSGVFEAANTSMGWSIKTPLTGTVGTVLERYSGGVVGNSGKFNASTGIFTGLAVDRLPGLLAFNRTLSATEIAVFN